MAECVEFIIIVGNKFGQHVIKPVRNINVFVIVALPSSMPPIASSPTVISPSTTPLSPSLPSQTTMTATPERSNRRVFLFAGVGGGLGGGVLLLCCVAVFIAGWCMHRKKATHQAYDVAGDDSLYEFISSARIVS